MTAEEFFQETHVWSTIETDGNYSLYDIYEAMVGFAKYHVEKALKNGADKALAFNKSKFKGDINPQVDMDSILEAYPLENIK